MGAREELRAAAPGLAWLAVVAGLVALVLTAAGAGDALTALVCAIIVAGGLVAIAASRLRGRAFRRELASFCSGSASPAWFGELVERPEDADGQLVHDAMTALAKSAADDVAASRRQVADYREYVETWVHEAKTPLATARLMLENLRDDVANAEVKPNGVAAGSLDLSARVRSLDDELDRLEGYIEQALFYARSETLDRDYFVRPYALRDLASGAVRANARSLIAAHVAPELGDLGETVFTDEKWMGFILGQVIQNSVKHARDEGARITFSSRVVGEGTADEQVELSVADNGCGVPASELPRVFDKGFTGTLGRSGKKATGIGLYLVRRLCDKMGVAVRAESVEGEGFTVVFGFPTDKYHYFES